jgi:lambda family phage tail tape measure protein
VARSIRVTLELDTKPFIDGLKKAESASNKFSQSVNNNNNKANQSFGLLQGALGQFSKLLGVGALIAYSKNVIGMGDAINDLSEATGFGITGIVGLQNALATSGGTADSAGNLLVKFSQILDDVSQGSDKALKQFQRIGLSLEDIQGATPEQVFQKVAEQLAKMPASAEKTALQVELLGKAAKGLAINEQFVENLRKSRERAEQFSSAIATAGKFTDAVSNSAQELGLRFLAVLEPALQLILDLGETFKDIDKTVKKLTDNAYGLAEAIQFIGSAAIAIIPFARGMSLLSKSIGAVLGGLGLFDVGKKILDGDDAQKKLAKSTKEAADAAKIQARANEEFVLSLEKITSEYKNQYELKLQDIAAQTEILGLSDAEQDIRKKILDFRKEEAKQIEILRQKVESSEGLNKQKAQESLDIFKAGQTARTQAFEDTIRAQEEAQRSFDVGFKNSMENYISDATNAARIARDVFQTATKGMEDSITKFVKTGKLSFRSLIADILETILRSQIQAIVAQIFSIGGKVGGGVLGNIGKVLGFANGGMIPTNGPVLVGERGPEIISGAQGRVVTPNNQLGGSMVTYYINAVDAMSFKQLIAQDPQFIYALTEQGRRSVPGTRR